MKCPVCNSKNTQHLYRIIRHKFRVDICNDCGSQFQNPLPKNANAFYDEGYYTGSSNFSYQDERRQEEYHAIVHRARLRSIRKFLAANEREKFLDVGAAFGAFTRSASDMFNAAGLDVSQFAVREGNKISHREQKNASLFRGDLAHLPKRNPAAKLFFTSNSIAAITLIEVAEHLQTPRIDFAAAYKLLKPHGVLVIQTSNFEGQQAIDAGADYHYYLPGHLIYYTATGLKRMLSEIGFREFKEFFPVDFSLWSKWRKAWGDIKRISDLKRFWNMSRYHIKSKFFRAGKPCTSSYVLYAFK